MNNPLLRAHSFKDRYLFLFFTQPAKFCFRHKISPNKITVFGYVFRLLSLIFLFENIWLTSLFLFISLYLDNLDGYLARQNNQTTATGSLLDHVGDFSWGWTMLIKAYFYYEQPFWLLLVVCLHFLNFIFLAKTKSFSTSSVFNPFEIFVLFGQYEIGLIIHAFGQPISFIYQIFDLSKNKPPIKAK